MSRSVMENRSSRRMSLLMTALMVWPISTPDLSSSRSISELVVYSRRLPMSRPQMKMVPTMRALNFTYKL